MKARVNFAAAFSRGWSRLGCHSGICHSGLRPCTYNHNSSGSSRAGALGLRALGLSLASELLGLLSAVSSVGLLSTLSSLALRVLSPLSPLGLGLATPLLVTVDAG